MIMVKHLMQSHNEFAGTISRMRFVPQTGMLDPSSEFPETLRTLTGTATYLTEEPHQ